MLRGALRIGLGVILIISGIAGVFLPVVPGILLIFIGMSLVLEKNAKVMLMDIIAKAKKRHKKRCV